MWRNLNFDALATEIKTKNEQGIYIIEEFNPHYLLSSNHLIIYQFVVMVAVGVI